MQCIMHIIINRIALIMYDARKVRRLKLAATLLIGVINITVFIIWIPARLQISERWVWINNIWDRIEKGIFAIFDLGLNLYFIYLVRSELTVHGLTKYRYLYLFNVGMIFISISLDVSRSRNISGPPSCLADVHAGRSSSLASCLSLANLPLCEYLSAWPGGHPNGPHDARRLPQAQLFSAPVDGR